MSYIQFESAREKEKARQDLREARQQMLEQAEKRAALRAEKEIAKQLKGETDWILPAVDKKLKKRAKDSKKSKKRKKESHKSKKSKKSRKKKSRKQDNDSSDSSSEDESSTDSTSSSSETDSRHRKRSKKSKKKSKRKSKAASSANSESESTEEKWIESKSQETPIQRDSWMTDTLILKTFSKEPRNPQPKEKQQIDAYDPAKSSRELNPYWKSTGTGLPSFQKPPEDDYTSVSSNRSSKTTGPSTSSKGWRKPSSNNNIRHGEHASPKINDIEENSTASSESSQDEETPETRLSSSDFLTDQQMNELGAKILKAEIMGNMTLAQELRTKLENARKQRNIIKDRKKNEVAQRRENKDGNFKHQKKESEEHILLTHTDRTGQSRPLAAKTIDPRDLYGGRKKQKQKRLETHANDGQRMRYFADDDRYDIKQMFEREKMTSVSDANLQFANIAAKNKNPNDDLEDIFADNIRKDDTARMTQKERDQATKEHQRMEHILDSCDKCFNSSKLQKELLISVGEKAYLALPWYQGFQSGHCIIVPTQHSTCCTLLDEDTWEEINDFRKALTRMFAAQRKDVIFFETANKLHKRLHLVIHCIPIKESEGEMAPFYFKKAIEESEHEWSVNKQLVSLRGKSLRSCIPKGLPYFWVHFGMDTGYAHVIEDEERFPQNFAQEILGGMLNLDAHKWRRLQKEQNVISKVKTFADWWKKYDFTQ